MGGKESENQKYNQDSEHDEYYNGSGGGNNE